MVHDGYTNMLQVEAAQQSVEQALQVCDPINSANIPLTSRTDHRALLLNALDTAEHAPRVACLLGMMYNDLCPAMLCGHCRWWM
jgi:hypothetical protein